MIDDPNDHYTPTRRETITWVAAALFTLLGRFVARQLTTRRPVWVVLAVTITPAIAWSIAFGATDKQSLTLGPSRVEAASEDAQPFGVAEALPSPTADARLQSGYVTAVPNATDAPAAERASGPAGEPLPAWLPPTVARWEANIRSAAGRYGVDPALVAIIVTVESAGNPRAGSGAGALGLMQVVPRWHPTISDGAGPYDPDHNLDVGAAFLAELLRTYAVAGDDDWQATVERAAAAFNGGPGGVTNPVAETRSYVRWIGGMWRERHADTSPTLDAWIAAGGQVALDIAATVDGPPADAPAAGPVTPFRFTPRVAPSAPDHLEVNSVQP